MAVFKIPNSAATYRSYASGSGAISFVYVDCHGQATGVERVPLHVAEYLKPEGWLLTDHNGDLEAYAPVNRANDILELGGRLFRYGVEYEGNGWRRYWFKDAETDRHLVNVSMFGSLTWWLNNEAALTKKKAG